ncbi:DUF6338 family protein [Halosegnis marinus]|uniref:DUF6338 family protein n=1 Tax=Halosegnis marinus TaxID=3034023 RepID=A0ABD5ZTQ5_9EURY|nr:DUF6338 family protein [Halosegnis sp. DT85]
MALGNLVGLNILSVILLIVPGVIGIKLYLYLRKTVDQYSRLDSIVGSIVLSLVSLILHYVLISVASRAWLTADGLTGLGIGTIIHGYLSIVALCLLLAGLLATIQHYLTPKLGSGRALEVRETVAATWPYTAVHDQLSRFGRPDATPRVEVWDHMFQQELLDDPLAKVVTTEGAIVEGEVMIRGNTVQSRDLLIDFEGHIPSHNENGALSNNETQYVYLHEQDISFISFGEIPDVDDEERDQGRRSERDHPTGGDVDEAMLDVVVEYVENINTNDPEEIKKRLHKTSPELTEDQIDDRLEALGYKG